MQQEKLKNFCQECKGNKYLIEDTYNYAHAVRCSTCKNKCRLCKGKGFIEEIDSEGIRFLNSCSCKQIDKKIALFNKAKIPNRFSHSSLEDYSQLSKDESLQQAYKKACNLVQKYPKTKGLVLTGKVGTGKTYLSCALIRDLIFRKEIFCLFVEFTNLLSEIKANYDNRTSEVGIMEKITSVPVLVIDELGKGKSSDWENSIIDGIITRRYNSSKVTIFTSNYTLNPDTTFKEKKYNASEKQIDWIKETLNNRISERIYSRLQEMCDIIEIKTEDLRVKKLNEGKIKIKEV